MNLKQSGLETSQKSMSQKHTKAVSAKANSHGSDSALEKTESSSTWRIYSSAMLTGKVERDVTPNFTTLCFLAHAEVYFKGIIRTVDLIDAAYYEKCSQLKFRTARSFSLVLFDKYMDRVINAELAFRWIPTTSVHKGRQACYCSVTDKNPFYRIDVEAEDDGMFSTLTVMIFEKKEYLYGDVNKAIKFYLGHGGVFQPNTDILEYIPVLELPKRTISARQDVPLKLI